MSVAFNLDAPGWHLVAERCCRFQINRVPGQLDERVAVLIGVRTCYIRTPITHWRGSGSPNTSLFGRYSRRIDVEAAERLAMIGSIASHETYCAAVPAQ